MDDFIGVETRGKIWSGFLQFQHTLSDIGITEAQDKRVEPTQKLNCVGTLVDAKNGTLEVLPERLTELKTEIQAWLGRRFCTLKQLQRLIGKLQFVCAVV